ncbi:hypothetical protein MHK71_10140 [Kocuria indica]|uniref:hypothetical protein n=1 Tax=Kocuria marina TaxID=223184 RepID=UPI001EF671ED|nr:hypothetical protein [Kocuria indica]MCG7432844.1 hypothetical protein [Kocuria indica]
MVPSYVVERQGNIIIVLDEAVVGFPFASSFGITPSSFPRSGVSNKPRALQTDVKAQVRAGFSPGLHHVRRSFFVVPSGPPQHSMPTAAFVRAATSPS